MVEIKNSQTVLKFNYGINQHLQLHRIYLKMVIILFILILYSAGALPFEKLLVFKHSLITTILKVIERSSIIKLAMLCHRY